MEWLSIDNAVKEWYILHDAVLWHRFFYKEYISANVSINPPSWKFHLLLSQVKYTRWDCVFTSCRALPHDRSRFLAGPLDTVIGSVRLFFLLLFLIFPVAVLHFQTRLARIPFWAEPFCVLCSERWITPSQNETWQTCSTRKESEPEKNLEERLPVRIRENEIDVHCLT